METSFAVVLMILIFFAGGWVGRYAPKGTDIDPDTGKMYKDQN